MEQLQGHSVSSHNI